MRTHLSGQDGQSRTPCDHQCRLDTERRWFLIDRLEDNRVTKSAKRTEGAIVSLSDSVTLHGNLVSARLNRDIAGVRNAVFVGRGPLGLRDRDNT